MTGNTVVKTVVLERGPWRVELELRLKPVQRVAPHLTIDLGPVPEDARELTLVASVTGYGGREDSAGQCRERVLEVLARDRSTPRSVILLALCALWERWHLNAMNAGTRAQREALKACTLPVIYPASHFGVACKYLESVGLLRDRGHSYGAAWLCEPLPPEVEAEAVRLMDELGGVS